jgi:ATP synthase protein I
MKGDDRGAEGRAKAPGDRRNTGSAAEFAGLGLQFAIAIVVFLYAGQWVDRRLGTSPLFLIVGVFLGAGGAFYSMYRRMTAAQKRRDEERRLK